MRNTWSYGVLAITLGLLLVPADFWFTVASLVVVVPVAVAGVRGQDRPLLLWAVYVVSFVVFAKVRGVADAIGPGPFVGYPILLDTLLGIGHVPTVEWQRWYNPLSPHWWDYAALLVYLTHFVSTPLVGVVVWRFRPRVLQPYLLGTAALFLVAAATHVFLPTAPPWIASQMGRLPVVFRPLVDLMGGLSPGVYEYGLSVAGGNDVAAMPSVHAAAATVIARASWGGRYSSLGVGYAVAMGCTLVYTGEHYVVDVVAGGGLALVCWRWAANAKFLAGLE